jgi:hypothetical protein
MVPEAQNYVEYLDTLRGRVNAAIEGMDFEELNWAPLNADTNSPCALACHLVGAEAMWIHHMVGGLDVSRDRDAEFAAANKSAASLVELLDTVGATSWEVLGKLTGDDLGKTRTRPDRPDAQPMVMRDSIVRMIGHLGEHVGHLELTKQLYEKRKVG